MPLRGLMKRYREPKANPGELKAQYGKLKHDSPDIIYAWGDGCSSADARLLHYVMSREWYHPADGTWGDSFIKELEKRGYDITTLKFSIKKLVMCLEKEDGEK